VHVADQEIHLLKEPIRHADYSGVATAGCRDCRARKLKMRSQPFLE
jgi:hypothetical protein